MRKVEMKRLSELIDFISTTEFGVIHKIGDMSAHIEGTIGHGGLGIRQNVS